MAVYQFSYICESVLPSLDNVARGPWNRFCRVLAGIAESSLGNHDRALSFLQAVEEEMDRNTLMFDWYTRMLLLLGLTDLWLAKGDLPKARNEAERFILLTQQTAEHTLQAWAFEAAARVALAEDDAPQAHDRIAQAISAMAGFEVPLAEWRVHGTAARVFEALGDREESQRHRDLSRVTILRLADSLASEEPLRQLFYPRRSYLRYSKAQGKAK
jgi:tetratricopeptide (TPR) repeat protein